MGESSDTEVSGTAGLAIPAKIRRVLLAEAPDGSSFVARDEEVEPAAFPGIGQIFSLWGTDSVFELPDSGTIPPFEGTFPPVGGFRVFLTRFAAHESHDASGGNVLEHHDMPSASDVHSSDTVDVNIVLSGVVDCVLSDKSVVKLSAGEMIVLNGAEHSWKNNTAEEAIMLFFMSGASRK